jgi:hypothetical protein
MFPTCRFIVVALTQEEQISGTARSALRAKLEWYMEFCRSKPQGKKHGFLHLN